jgi:hypothetical protein
MPQLNTPQLPSRLSQLNKPQKVLSSHTICTSPLAPTPMLAPARTPSPCQVLPADDQYAIQLKVACTPPACVRARGALHFEGKEEVTDRPARQPIDVRSRGGQSALQAVRSPGTIHYVHCLVRVRHWCGITFPMGSGA